MNAAGQLQRVRGCRLLYRQGLAIYLFWLGRRTFYIFSQVDTSWPVTKFIDTILTDIAYYFI